MHRPRAKIVFLAFAIALSAHAQSAEQAWLKYTSLKKPLNLPNRAEALGSSPVEQSAVAEISRGMRGLFGIAEPRAGYGSIVLGTRKEFEAHGEHPPASLAPDEYAITWSAKSPARNLEIIGGSGRAVLYGTFALLRLLATDQDVSQLDLRSKPSINIRWVDEWDNADGSIERGYAGRSIFFDAGHVREDLAPVGEYARLLASIGINGCNVNNVNGSSPFLAPELIRGLAKIADTMRPYGVRLAISVDIASPQKIGGLPTYDPADPAVKAWWNDKVNEIYALIPDFAGFTVKADSEGQPGPASYGRTPADAANTLAAALEPHNGVVLYRAFVYNPHLDWNDPKADRARAAYDIFHPLDGKFASNVIVQIKEGPIDFQAREPVSPLFGGLTATSQAMEVQITQEYTGQQRHLVYLAPMWKQVLDFDLRVRGLQTPVKLMLAGGLRPGDQKSPIGEDLPPSLGGMVGVAGIGQTAWLNSPLALANLYAFARLAWDPDLTPEKIAEEWTRQTISNDATVIATVDKMLMQSWPAYESYTGPLGLQTLTDITGSHYGPNVESSERNGWGQWHRADHDGVGMDRSVATGTGFAGQYQPDVAKIYENAATTPDDLLLFFHHVPYTYKLHDGKTVIQYLYDSHYDGAAQAAGFVHEWDTLKGKIDPELYNDMRSRLVYQAGHAIVWRDAIVQYFRRLTGIPDEQGRAGHYPNRLEAEEAHLIGYTVIDVTPWEDASGGRAIACGTADASTTQSGQSSNPATNLANTNGHGASAIHAPCTAIWTYTGPAGKYDIAVQYFDLQGGTASFVLEVNHKTIGTWQAAAQLPSRRPDGDNSVRITFPNVELATDDEIRIVGTPDNAVQADHAVLDYIEITAAGTAP